MRLGSGAFAAGLVVIEALGVALFLRGFFPAPVRPAPRTEQRAAPPVPEPAAGAASNWTKLPPPLFSKVVIMLIDALRDDFVFGSKGAKYMPYTTYVVEKGASHSFVAEAKPPTVTMPRIKALMTGSLPGFIDIVRNLNSPALLEDSIIGQAAAAGKRIIFYGDETWVKLFPKHFVEYDGTTSFFVSDYTEVDDNVTRHLDGVLGRQDWDVLILHYLGLDHIGHVFGPSSPLVGRKLREMDSILMKVHTALLSEEKETLSPTLLVLCGDHGMSETGSHGASSREEVNTPLVLVSSSFARKPGDVRRPEHAQQTDLAATLAVGLGVPIPESSVGRLLLPVVEGRPLREQLRLLHLNAVQLSRLLQENVPSHQKEPGFEQFKMSERLHGSWVQLYLEGGSTEVLLGLGAKVRRQYLGTLKTLSMSLSRQVAQYDIYSMAVGTVVVLEVRVYVRAPAPPTGGSGHMASAAVLGTGPAAPVSTLQLAGVGSPWSNTLLALQVLALLLLCTPWALGREAELEVPLSSPAFSLLFYLAFLVLLAVHVVVCTSAEGTCYLCSLPWLAAGSVMLLASALLCAAASAFAKALASVRRLAQNDPARWASSWSEVDLLILLGTAGHALSLGASSFVEEEHQTWYFLVSTLCLALCHEVCRNCFLGNPREPQEEPAGWGPGPLDQAPRSPSPTLASLKGCAQWRVLVGPWAVLACCRLLRALNRTGVQWAHRPGLGHWLASSEHKAALSALCALSLAGIFALAHQRCSRVSKVALALGLLGVYCYRAAIGSVLCPWQPGSRAISKGVAEARAVYAAVLGLLAAGARDALGARGPAAGLRELHGGLVLLAALLLRPHNLPVLLGCLLVQALLAACVWRPLRPSAAAVAAMHHWFGQAFFFFQGNSNGVASVDVSAGFVGLDGYARVPAALLTAFATYAGPVLWASHLASFLAAEARSSALSHACFCYALVCSLPVSAYIVLVTSLRYHLFIWSVFSPKLLYEGTRLLITAVVCVLFAAADRTHPGPRQSCCRRGE